MKYRSRHIGDRIFDFAVYFILISSMLIVAYPLIYVISSSFSSPEAVMSGKVVLFPVDFSLLAYRSVFKYDQIMVGYANSLIYMVLGTAVNLILTVLAAFPLSRKQFYGRNVFMAMFVFTMLFSGGLIPYYMVVNKLGMVNTLWAMILPSGMSVFNVILARTYFQSTIPEELYESAELDGCSIYKMIGIIVIPLSGPILAVISLYCAVGIWNSYFEAFIFISKKQLYPLQLVLRSILIVNKMDASMLMDVEQIAQKQGLVYLLKYSVIVVASAPLLIIYPFVQKFFIKGIMVGSLKG